MGDYKETLYDIFQIEELPDNIDFKKDGEKYFKNIENYKNTTKNNKNKAIFCLCCLFIMVGNICINISIKPSLLVVLPAVLLCIILPLQALFYAVVSIIYSQIYKDQLTVFKSKMKQYNDENGFEWVKDIFKS